ncbi:MAG: tautomerase family protein [Acidithiobacillus sp.]
MNCRTRGRFLGVDRSDDLVVVQITMRRGRSDAMKRDLYDKIAENLNTSVGVRPQDVFIYLTENDFSDWSVGNGQMSMAIVQQRGASVEHLGVGRTAPANPSFERTPLRGFARVSLRALRALRPHAGAAQLAPR